MCREILQYERDRNDREIRGRRGEGKEKAEGGNEEGVWEMGEVER